MPSESIYLTLAPPPEVLLEWIADFTERVRPSVTSTAPQVDASVLRFSQLEITTAHASRSYDDFDAFIARYDESETREWRFFATDTENPIGSNFYMRWSNWPNHSKPTFYVTVALPTHGGVDFLISKIRRWHERFVPEMAVDGRPHKPKNTRRHRLWDVTNHEVVGGLVLAFILLLIAVVQRAF